MSDASLIAGGSFEYKQGNPFKLAASGTATVGAHMTQWLSRHGELPEDLKLHSPLKISAERLSWRAGGDLAFRGQVTVAGGPHITLDGVKAPQRFAVQNLTVNDGNRRAQMTLQVAKDNLDLSFKGELAQQTLDKIFASFPLQDSALKGDLQVRAALNTPVRFSARGQLEGSNLWLPLEQDKIQIDKFRIEASEGNVLIRSADLRWGNSRLAVSGKVAGDKEALRMDIDVSSNRLSWENLERFFGSKGKPRQDADRSAVSLPAVQGTIRLKTDSFVFDRYNVSSLQITAAISPSGIRAQIDKGVACGINATGRVDVAGEELGLDVQLSATEALLEPTTLCLSERKNDVKGTYSLKARITGRGERNALLRSLKGSVEFSARDGEFVRSPGVDATFDYLNATGDFKVAFPDLDKETFPYRLVSIKGRIDGEIFTGDEVIIQSSLLDVTGQGKIDLARKQIDGKGLIAVLKPVDQVLNRIPLVGSIFGGTLLGIPIRITGPLDRPEVSYLSPGDVGTELLNVPMRILGIPLEAIRLFTPNEANGDKGIGK
jgi:AsmA-like protein